MYHSTIEYKASCAALALQVGRKWSCIPQPQAGTLKAGERQTQSCPKAPLGLISGEAPQIPGRKCRSSV